jgi:hypothetical protein
MKKVKDIEQDHKKDAAEWIDGVKKQHDGIT